MATLNTCDICYKKVQSFCIHIECVVCHVKCHAKCVNMNSDDILKCDLWYCPSCPGSVLPYNHFDCDDDFKCAVIEGMLYSKFKINEISNKLFCPFEINQGIETPLPEIDPDMQFYSNSHYIQNLNCDYYLEETFAKEVEDCSATRNSLSFFHLNIKSLPKHYDELEIFRKSLDYDFSFIGLTETWLDENKQDLYDLPGYNCIHRYREGRRGGGVSLCMRNGISFTNRNDLEYFDSEMETIFIEIDSTVFGTQSNVVVAVIYRMPDSSVDVFNERICDIMNVITKETKICYLVGDLNIDLLKHEEHRPTSDFVDILYANNMFPLILKPTRVTDKSATLIDHIMTNNFDVFSRHKQGILMSSISDHYAIFHIAGNSQFQPSFSNHKTLKRDMRHQKIQKFVHEMKIMNWNQVLECDDAQLAYTTFHATISEKYNKCFPLRNFSSNLHTNKNPWLTPALKESIKMKHKLYIKRNGGITKRKTLYFINIIEAN